VFHKRITRLHNKSNEIKNVDNTENITKSKAKLTSKLESIGNSHTYSKD